LKSVIGKHDPHLPPLWNDLRRWNTLSRERMFAGWLPNGFDPSSLLARP